MTLYYTNIIYVEMYNLKIACWYKNTNQFLLLNYEK